MGGAVDWASCSPLRVRAAAGSAGALSPAHSETGKPAPHRAGRSPAQSAAKGVRGGVQVLGPLPRRLAPCGRPFSDRSHLRERRPAVRSSAAVKKVAAAERRELQPADAQPANDRQFLRRRVRRLLGRCRRRRRRLISERARWCRCWFRRWCGRLGRCDIVVVGGGAAGRQAVEPGLEHGAEPALQSAKLRVVHPAACLPVW